MNTPPIFQAILDAKTVADGGASLVLDFERQEYRVRSAGEVRKAVATAEDLALIGDNPVRLFMFGMAPQNIQKPYGVWQVISGSPESYLAGRPDTEQHTLQVDVYADTASTARAALAAIEQAIEQDAYVTRYGGESRDPETQNYRSSMDVDWITYR